MAAFYKYICRFTSCNKKFNCLHDLIDHIEFIHIERDPVVLQKQELSQPAAVALSYVNCFFSEAVRRNRPPEITAQSESLNKKCKIPNDSLNDSYESLIDDADTLSDAGSDDSCQSWSTSASGGTQPEVLTLNGSQNNPTTTTVTVESLQGKFSSLEDSEGKKRYMCTVPGCGKRYKNINGIKYHVKNGHNKKEINGGNNEVRKSYICHCGKAYKSQSGLRHHQNTQHGQGNQNSIQPPSNGSAIQYDARLDNNFKQPQVKQRPLQMNSLPPVSEVYQPQNVLPSPSAMVT